MSKFGTETRADHVQDMWWYRGRRYENNDIFPKICTVGQHLLRWPIPAGWLAGCKALAKVLAGCSRLAACTAATVTWQACRYLIDLSGKRLVNKNTARYVPVDRPRLGGFSTDVTRFLLPSTLPVVTEVNDCWSFFSLRRLLTLVTEATTSLLLSTCLRLQLLPLLPNKCTSTVSTDMMSWGSAELSDKNTHK